MNQKTLNRRCWRQGIGLHSGREVSVELIPRRINEGINFLVNGEIIPFNADNITNTELSTTVGGQVSTVEHLMSALYICGVTNLIIKVDGDEIPVLDGSAIEWANLIRSVGVVSQNDVVDQIRVARTLEVTDGDSYIRIVPNNKLVINFSVDFKQPIGIQQHTLLNEEDFFTDIAPARTFGFLEDFSYLKERGLGLGVSLNNVVGFTKYQVMNKEGLRFDNEPVRHKILDLIGDFSALGRPLIGYVEAYKSGHKLNHLMVKEILDNEI